MSKIKFSNFHVNTFANFQKIKTKDIPDKKPNFISKSGSRYWFIKDSVIRQSNHWGRTIRTCNWLLDSNASNKSGQGICKLSDFKAENLNILKEGKKFKVTKTVLIRNGGGKMNIDTYVGKFVKATSDFYIFDSFKVATQTIACIELAK